MLTWLMGVVMPLKDIDTNQKHITAIDDAPTDRFLR